MILVFDGVCNLCGGFVRFLLKRDRQAGIRFATTQSDYGATCMRQAGLDPDDPASILLVMNNKTLIQSDAVLSVVASLGGVWRLASIGRLVPRPLRDRVYRWVACNRYRWFGRASHCAVPDPAWRDRLLP